VQLKNNRRLDKYLGCAMIALLLPFTRLLGMLLHRNHHLNNPPKKILFIKLAGLGSLVVATDSIEPLRKKLPSTKFILLTDNTIAAGISPIFSFDEIWVINSNKFFSVAWQSLKYLFRSWKLTDLWVVDLEVYSKLTTVYSLLTCAKNRFGFFLPQVHFRKYLNTHNIFFNRSDFLDNNYDFMMSAVIGEKNSKNHSVIRRKNEKQKTFIVLNNTCSDLAPERKLPEETVAEVCQWILRSTHYQVAFSGTYSDKISIDELIDKNPRLNSQKNRIINIAGKYDFNSYYNFLSNDAACMITIDSGPLHIARKLGLPTVSIWGPTDPAHYLKVAAGEEQRNLFYYSKIFCSPCVHVHEKLPCGGNNICMKNILAEDVISKISVMLEQLSEG
jgi:ADP-heptose:LPS heptosyltransferase